MRVCYCKNCGKQGHYQKKCPNKSTTPAPENKDLGQGERKTLKEIGREILEQQNQKVEREPDVLGTIPVKGLWIVNIKRRRVAGKISQIKKDGMILWTDAYGGFCETSPIVIKDAGYCYLELESIHLQYEVISFPK